MLILSPTSIRKPPAGSFTVINRQRTGLERILDSLSVWDWCKPDPTYDNTDLLLEAIAGATQRGCSLNMSLQPGTPFTQLSVREQVLFANLSALIGDNQNASRGCCLAFVPSLSDTVNSADLRTGFVNQGSNISNILFVASVNDRVNGTNNGMNPAVPSTLTTSGAVAPWGPNGVTSLIDPATFFANGAVQLVSGVGMYPGVIPLETQEACAYNNVQTLYGKIGHWSASGSGHVMTDSGCSFSGALVGEHYHINGQDYENNVGGRSGGLAAVTVGNTNSVNVIGGYTGSMKRIHFYGSGFGVLQVQDDVSVTLQTQRPNGFAGTMESCSMELIGEQLLHMYNPQDGSNGGLFALEATNLNAGFDYEGGIYKLPPDLTAAMGITSGQYGAELGYVIGLTGMKDFGNGATFAGTSIAGGGSLSISGVLRTVNVDFSAYGTSLPVRCGVPIADVPLSFTSPIGAAFDDLANHRDFLTVGSLLLNPEIGVDTTAAETTTPGFYRAGVGYWGPNQTDTKCMVRTLDQWRLLGEDLDMEEAVLAKLSPKTPIFRFTTISAQSYSLQCAAPPSPDDRSISASFVGSQGVKAVLLDSNYAAYFGELPIDGVIESAKTLKYRKGSFTIRPGLTPTFLNLYLSANSVIYFAAPMVNYGRPAPYNPNPGPGLSSGHGIPTAAGAQPANIIAPGFWIDSSAGFALKVAQ